ncbi:MAG: hypothetical protein MUP15_08865 [Dehalococcoidia bacterium]|nr:hypothetical protein [Dehalococcoidia bacterium]
MLLPSGLAEVYNGLLMEPRIQYAKVADGVSIAFWTLGDGMPFMHLPWGAASCARLDWQRCGAFPSGGSENACTRLP